MTKDPVTNKPIPSYQSLLGRNLWKAIQEGAQLRRNPRFIGVTFSEEVNGLPAGAIHRLSRLSKTFVKYEGDSQQLPKWNSKGEVI
jgi:hypothetical protein